MLTYSNEDFKTLLKEIFWVSGKKFGILSENKDHNGSVIISKEEGSSKQDVKVRQEPFL